MEEVRSLCNMKIFVDTDDDVRLARRIKRDTLDRGRDVNGARRDQHTRSAPRAAPRAMRHVCATFHAYLGGWMGERQCGLSTTERPAQGTKRASENSLRRVAKGGKGKGKGTRPVLGSVIPAAEESETRDRGGLACTCGHTP